MLKKILISLGLSLALLNTGSMLASAYQVDQSFKPDNEPFALETEIKERGASGAAIVVLQLIAGALLWFATPIGVIMIVWSGSNMVINGTEQEKLEGAKKHLKWSIIGLVAIILSYAAVRIIIGFVLKAASLTADT